MSAVALEGAAFKNCTRCPLSQGRKHAPIPGYSPCPMGEVRLIVVSAYPGTEEVKSGQSLFPSPTHTMNAGKILQTYMQKMSQELGYDLYHRTYRTNAMKCPPKGKKGDKLTEPRNICKAWLMAEIEEVPAGVPILLAGTDAVQSILGKGLYESRNIVHRYGNHPVVVTMNPIEVERATRFTYSSNGEVVGAPPVVGSVGALWVRDMRLLTSLLSIGNTQGGNSGSIS